MSATRLALAVVAAFLAVMWANQLPAGAGSQQPLASMAAPTGFATTAEPPYPSSPSMLDANSVRVIEGDTMEVRVGRAWGIGILGIQAPPGNTDCGRAAAKRLQDLTNGGVMLRQEAPHDLDERDRRLYHAFGRDGANLAETLLREGLALVAGPVHANTSTYAAIESQASSASAGCVWGGPLPAPGLMAFPGPSIQAPMGPFGLPDGFVQEVLLSTTLDIPVSVVTVPDGRIFVAFKEGIVRVIDDGILLPDPVIDLSARVNAYWDRGIHSMAVDPAFSQNGYIYLYYAYEHDPSAFSGPKTGRLARYTLTGNSASLESEFIILGRVSGPGCGGLPAGADCIPADSCCHAGGVARFADDGSLLFSTGDAAFAESPDERALRVQDIDSLAGKVLRMTREGYGLPTNPFWNGNPSAIRSKVYAYGFRNPWRFDLKPGSGVPFAGDVGWNDWEELNVVTPGANFGWPCYEGPNIQPGYAPKPACQALYALGASAVTMPLYTYPHDATHGSITGGFFYTGDAFPSEYEGRYFFADFVAGWVKHLSVDDENHLVPDSIADFQAAPNADGPIDIHMGVDGAIYYTQWLFAGHGEVRRLRYTANGAPVAVASSDKGFGLTPLEVQFSSAGSSDPNGDVLTYLWDFGDGTSSNAANPSHTYNLAGTYEVTLTVSDGQTPVQSDPLTIVAGNTPPDVTISSPGALLTYQVGDTIELSGSAVDAQDGPVPGASLSWSVTIRHCPGHGQCHSHPYLSSNGSATASFEAPDHGSNFNFEIKLTAVDSQGLAGEAIVAIHPQTVTFSLTTSPPGLVVLLDGIPVVAPVDLPMVVGSQHTIEAPALQGDAAFWFWAGGGDRVQTFEALTARSMTAHFLQAPLVYAGPRRFVSVDETVSLAGSVTYETSIPLSWTKVSGPGSVSFANAATAVTTARFSTEGSYVLRLTASNDLFKRSDDVTLNVVRRRMPERFVLWEAHESPAFMAPGDSATAHLTFTNVGGATWLAGGPNEVHAGYRWLEGACPGEGDPVPVPGVASTALPADVPYNATVAGLALTVLAPENPGLYCLFYDLQVASGEWFSDGASPALATNVRIVPRRTLAVPE